ncbi:MAG: hypothetical protein ACRERC_12435 [Candidatus Binatia bacterium]
MQTATTLRSLTRLLILGWCASGAIGTLPALGQVVVGAGSTLAIGSGAMDHGCADLAVAGTLRLGSGQAFGIGALSIGAGALLAGEAGALSWSGDWSNAGQFQAGTSSASWVDGCGAMLATMQGTQQFHTLIVLTDSGREVRFASGQTTQVAVALTLGGSPGQPLLIRSTTAGSPAFLDLLPGATQFVSAVDVADNFAVGQPIGAPGPASNYDSIKGSESNGWFERAATVEQVPATSMLGLLLATAALMLAARRQFAASEETMARDPR